MSLQKPVVCTDESDLCAQTDEAHDLSREEMMHECRNPLQRMVSSPNIMIYDTLIYIYCICNT